MTEADQSGADQHNVSQESGLKQEEEDAHVTLTAVHDTQKTEGLMQSSFVLSDFTEKLLNFENVSPADNEIASLMDTTVCHEEQGSQTSSLYSIPIKAVPEITFVSTATILIFYVYFLSTFVVALETSTIALVISSVALSSETIFVAFTHRMVWLGSLFEVTTRLSSSSEFPIAPVTSPPRIRRRSAILIRPREAIPFGQPYRTHLNGPRKLLTARIELDLSLLIVASRHALPRSLDHHSSSSSSSSDSLPVHSLGFDTLDQAHSGSSTRDVPPRLYHLQEMLVPDLIFVPSSTPVMGSLDPTRDDLLPPCKRSCKIGLGDVKDDTLRGGFLEPAGEDSSDSSGTRDGIVRSFSDMLIDLDDVVHDFYHRMSEVCIDRIVGIETAHRRLEAESVR
ncbi:hypothetical protein Tco_0604051 [Tanacetum coccineum]